MKRSLIVLFCLLFAMPVFAGQSSGTLGVGITITEPNASRGEIQFTGAVVDPNGASFNPMAPKNLEDPRYPENASGITCHQKYNMCFTPSGRHLGTIEYTLQYLPRIDPAAGLASGTLACDKICYDYLGRVVGRAQ